MNKFFRNKSILITGATGFVGKCLVEKLVRDVPQLSKLYLLVRPKAKETVKERSAKYFDHRVFEGISGTHGKLVEFVEGDTTRLDCGMNSADQEILKRNVDIVIHSAADISFMMSVQKAVANNTAGTNNLLKLATKFEKLQAFVSISTTYSCPNDVLIREKVYPMNVEPLQAIKLFSKLPLKWEQKLNKCGGITGKNRNTYQYSKQLAENKVESYEGRLPVCIVRPAIVLAANKEPYIGWTEAEASTSIYWLNILTGVNHTSLIDPNNTFAVTPTDTLVNTVLAAAWRTATTKSSEFLVYNCVADQHNELTYKRTIKWGLESLREQTPQDAGSHYPWTTCTRYRTIFLIKQVLFRLVPSVVFNTVANGRPNLRKCFRSFYIASAYNILFSPGTLSRWNLTTNNMKQLNELMSPEDRQKFPIDLSQIYWETFIKNFVQGLFKFQTEVDGATKTPANLSWLKVKHWFLEITVWSPVWMLPIVCSYNFLVLV